MKYKWEDLPKPINGFTTRNTVMMNLNNGKVVQYYGSNTKIVLAQKCVTEVGTYYRTESAAYNNLNWAFEAAAFGLPNEILAPPVPPNSTKKVSPKKPSSLKEKQKSNQKAMAKGGEPKKQTLKSKLFSLFRRK